MKTVRTVAEVRSELGTDRSAGRRIGLVPTMGAFHAGHLALIRAARAASDVLVVSLFVNPSQFDDARDLERYPRDEAADATLAERVPHRPDEGLDQRERQREGGGEQRHPLRRRRELVGERGDEGVSDARAQRAGEAGNAKEED